MSYNQAFARLPTDATWSCSFGNPGQAGYVEYWRITNGDRWMICNAIGHDDSWYVVSPANQRW